MNKLLLCRMHAVNTFVLYSSGLMISAICDDEKAAIQMALGSVYPSLLMSGKLSLSTVMGDSR